MCEKIAIIVANSRVIAPFNILATWQESASHSATILTLTIIAKLN